MRKTDLRKIYLEKRRFLKKEDITDLSQKIADLFFQQFNISSFQVAHIFLPIQDKQEVDTWFIIKNIWLSFSSVKIAVSKVDFVSGELVNCFLSPDTALEYNAWGIPEPDCNSFIDPKEISVVLLPLLCFDKGGNRVGYGKGFYDRFLLTCSKNVLKIGLSFFEPIEKINDLNLSDVPMDFCITPTVVHKFK